MPVFLQILVKNVTLTYNRMSYIYILLYNLYDWYYKFYTYSNVMLLWNLSGTLHVKNLLQQNLNLLQIFFYYLYCRHLPFSIVVEI